MIFSQPVWAPDGVNTGMGALAAVRQSVVSQDTVVVTDEQEFDAETSVHLNAMEDGIRAGVLEAQSGSPGALEKFIEVDERLTHLTTNHIASLIEQEGAIQMRIERDVILLLKTRKVRMGAEANLRILTASDEAVISLLQVDPLNTATGAVKIAADGATTEGGTQMPFRRDASSGKKQSGEEGK